MVKLCLISVKAFFTLANNLSQKSVIVMLNVLYSCHSYSHVYLNVLEICKQFFTYVLQTENPIYRLLSKGHASSSSFVLTIDSSSHIYIIHTTTIYNQSQKSVRLAPPVSLFHAGCKFAWPFLATIAWRNFSRLGTALNQGEGEFGVSLSKPYIFLRTFHENIVRIFVTDCEIFREYSVHKFL